MRLLHPCSPPLKWLHQTKSQHDQCPLPERLRQIQQPRETGIPEQNT